MKNKLLTVAITIMCVWVTYHTLYHEPTVKKGMIEIYDEYLSKPDIIMKSKQAFPERSSLRELVIDSITLQKQHPLMNLFIALPVDTVKGRVHEIYWDTIPRFKILIFENMLKK